MNSAITIPTEIRHGHLFCGLGGGAKGFNEGHARVGALEARFRCIGGIDVNPAAIRNFEKLAGVRGTVLDLFDRDQYKAFHGVEPPRHWREAMPSDIVRAMGGERPHIWFLSAPCKGFSGLLAESSSRTPKYQALNRLTLRGIWLALEAYVNDPVELIVFENVPRITSRGRHLLDQIIDLLRRYGYAVSETTHDCGELGGLAQSRKRFLLVARHVEKVPPFLYEPEKKTLQAVGTLLGRMPLPGDAAGGPMHRIPSLQWKTWVRLAFVEAGSDWRSLNKLAVEDGYLRDYLLVPEMHNGALGVRRWNEPSGVVAGASRPMNGSFSVADPRAPADALHYRNYGVVDWNDSSGAIIGVKSPGQGMFSVADPRAEPSARWNHGQNYGVVAWSNPSGAISGQQWPNQGRFAVADPRHNGTPKHNNEFHIVPWNGAAGAVTSAHGTGQCVQDPRSTTSFEGAGKYRVTCFDEPAGTVIARSDSGQGAYSVADPRPPAGPLFSKYKVTDWAGHAGTVIGGDDQGAYAVADPRSGIQREKGDNYLTAGHYGVVSWDQPSGAVSSAACHDNGRWSVADPRLPAANEKTIAVIRSVDGTWHRPFTTLELAVLQSLVDPEEYLELDGLSDQEWREQIGNAVPRLAGKAIASVMGTTLLQAWSGTTSSVSKQPIWVRNVAVALSVSQPM